MSWQHILHIHIPALLIFNLNFGLCIKRVSIHLLPEASDKLCCMLLVPNYSVHCAFLIVLH